jgi:hypothetical protein
MFFYILLTLKHVNLVKTRLKIHINKNKNSDRIMYKSEMPASNGRIYKGGGIFDCHYIEYISQSVINRFGKSLLVIPLSDIFWGFLRNYYIEDTSELLA